MHFFINHDCYKEKLWKRVLKFGNILDRIRKDIITEV